MITITDNAVTKLKEIQQKKNMPNHFLRLAIRGGGCSGFSYGVDFTDKTEATDKTWEVHGLKIAVDPKSYLYLNGTTLEYSDDLLDGGFKFKNPNATGSCGCGKSVSF